MPGLEALRGVPRVAVGGRGDLPAGPKPSSPESNWILRVGDRVGDAGGPGTRRLARGDRVVRRLLRSTMAVVASRFVKVSDWPALTTGGRPRLPGRLKSPSRRGSSRSSRCSRDRPLASVRASRSLGRGLPPWLSFSARWPWVSSPRVSTFDLNGSLAFGLCRRRTRHHDPHRLVPGRPARVVGGRDVQPVALLDATLQSGLVAVIETSHDTAPAGSKYFATERNSSLGAPAARGLEVGVAARPGAGGPRCRSA